MGWPVASTCALASWFATSWVWTGSPRSAQSMHHQVATRCTLPLMAFLSGEVDTAPEGRIHSAPWSQAPTSSFTFCITVIGVSDVSGTQYVYRTLILATGSVTSGADSFAAAIALSNVTST